MKNHTIKGITVGIACVVVIGLTSYAFGFFGKHESAMQLIQGAYGAGELNIDKTAHVSMDFQKKKNSKDTQSIELGKMHMIVSQKVNADPAQSMYQISLDGYVIEDETAPKESRIDIAGDIVFSNKMFYIHPTKIPAFPYFNPAAVADKWFTVDIVSLARQFGGEEEAKTIEAAFAKAFGDGRDEDRKALGEIFQKHNFIESPRIIGTETIDGHNVKDVSFTINKKVLADFITATNQYQMQKTGMAMSAEDIAASTERTKSLLNAMVIDPIVLGISPENHYLYSVKGRIEMKDPEFDPSEPASFESVIVTFSGTEDYTTPVVIVVPKNSTSFEKLLGQIFGGMMTSTGSESFNSNSY